MMYDAENSKEQLLNQISNLNKKLKESEILEDKLKALNQQLTANEQQLKSYNQQLVSGEQQLLAANMELKSSALELKTEKDFSEKIVNNSRAIMIGLDKDHLIRIFNKGAEDITGYSQEEVLGKDWLKMFFPKEMFEEMNMVWKDAWGILSHSYVNPILTKTKEERIISWQSTGFYDGKDTSKHLLISIGDDITKQIKAENNLRQEHSRIVGILNSIPYGIYIVNNNFDIEYINSVLENDFGQVNNQKCYKYFHDRDEVCPWCKNKEIEAGNSVEWEWYSQKNNRHYTLFDSPIVNNDGSVSKFEIFQDITDRKKSEESMKLLNGQLIANEQQLRAANQQLIASEVSAKESEERYRLLAENVSDVIWVYNLTKESFTYVSSSIFQLRGMTAEEAMRLTLFESLPVDSAKRISKNIPIEVEKFKKGIADTFKIELEQVHKDGRLLWIEIITKLQYAKDGSIEALGVSRDITERKAVDQQLKANNQQLMANNQQLIVVEQQLKSALVKALESDRLKSAFLSNMSHEIRTPMNGIVGFVNLINEPDISSEERHKYAVIINRSSKRLQNTINDLIDISRIEAGQVKVKSTKTSIHIMLEELLAFFMPEATSKGIALAILPSLKAKDTIVITDNDKLFGILSNLIKNAIKYTPKGSITFGYFLNEGFVELFVKDSGIGVPKDRQQAIFNRFEQADIEDTGAFEGSGLGLAIAKAYVDMLGGEIWLISEEGKGSEFKFTIPYNIDNTTKEKLTKSSHIALQNEKGIDDAIILIAEDDDVCCLLFDTILKKIFRKIIYVKNGADAIEACKNNPEIDVILMDIKMPIMNGYVATHEIRKFNKNVIIIAQTAYALTGDKEQALQVGCNDYIAKPIEKTMLIDMINRHLKIKKKQ